MQDTCVDHATRTVYQGETLACTVPLTHACCWCLDQGGQTFPGEAQLVNSVGFEGRTVSWRLLGSAVGAHKQPATMTCASGRGCVPTTLYFMDAEM